MKQNTKKFLFLLILLSFGFTGNTQTHAKFIASCCENDGGRCSGSSSCTACTNCSRCKHCSNGGTCGVCSDDEEPIVRHTRKTTPKNSTSSPKVKFYKSQPVFITVAFINLRQGPGTNFKILEKIVKGNRVFIQEDTQPWIKVKVEKTGTMGYVHSDNLK